jgi:hypothetical protein
MLSKYTFAYGAGRRGARVFKAHCNPSNMSNRASSGRDPATTRLLAKNVSVRNSLTQAVAVENLALRLRLAAFKRKRKPVLTQLDRLFWVGLSQFWSGWRDSLVFVLPDTVVRWQRDRFRRSWARLSQPSVTGEEGPPWLPGCDS